MSETVHYKGILIPTGKTLKEFDPKAKHTWDLLYKSAIEIDGQIYTIEKEEIDDSNLFLSKKNEDGTINFEIRYYNGGCSFDEAIREALKNKEIK